MRKFLALPLLLLLASLATFGQTLVSGTVTDAASVPWANATYTFTSLAFGQSPITGSLSSTGTFTSVSIPHNAATAQVGDIWTLKFQPNASAGPFTVNQQIGPGSTQSLTLTPAALSIPIATGSPVVSAYADSELTGAIIGSTYYNTGALAGLRTCIALPCSSNFSSASGSPSPTNGTKPRNSFVVSPNCLPNTSLAPCAFINADLRVTADCQTTNGQPTITSASAAFTSADIGKLAYCVDASSTGLAIKGTVLSITSGTILVVNANAGETNSGLNLAIGHDDGTLIHNASIAAVATGALGTGGGLTGLSLPCALILIDSGQPLFATGPTGAQNASVGGCPDGGAVPLTTLVLGPDFIPTTGCTGGSGTFVCIFSATSSSAAAPIFTLGDSETISNLRITSMSLNLPFTSNGVTLINTAVADNIEIINFLSKNGGGIPSTCMNNGAGETRYTRLNLQGNNCIEISVSGQGDNVLSQSVVAFNAGAFNGAYSFQCGTNSLSICNLVDNYFINNTTTNNHTTIQVTNASTLNIIGGLYSTTANQNIDVSTGTVNLAETQVLQNSATQPNITIEGGILGSHQSVIQNINAGGRLLNVTGTGTFDDVDGNTTPGIGTTAQALIIIADGHELNGACTGAATASTTLGIYGTGPNVTATTCTSTNIGTGLPSSSARTLQNFSVTEAITATTSTTYNVLVNGSASALTCTIAAAATTCNDITHTVAVNAGDLISFNIVAGAATTPSGIKMFVHWN